MFVCKNHLASAMLKFTEYPSMDYIRIRKLKNILSKEELESAKCEDCGQQADFEVALIKKE